MSTDSMPGDVTNPATTSANASVEGLPDRAVRVASWVGWHLPREPGRGRTRPGHHQQHRRHGRRRAPGRRRGRDGHLDHHRLEGRAVNTISNGPDESDMAHGRITGAAVDWSATFSPAHRVGNPTPARLTCTVTMPLSLDDVAGALLAAGEVGVLQQDVTTLEDLHAVVVFMLINHNREVAAARKRLIGPLPGSPEFDDVTVARGIAIRLYGNTPDNRARFSDTTATQPDRPLRAVQNQPDTRPDTDQAD